MLLLILRFISDVERVRVSELCQQKHTSEQRCIVTGVWRSRSGLRRRRRRLRASVTEAIVCTYAIIVSRKQRKKGREREGRTCPAEDKLGAASFGSERSGALIARAVASRCSESICVGSMLRLIDKLVGRADCWSVAEATSGGRDIARAARRA